MFFSFHHSYSLFRSAAYARYTTIIMLNQNRNLLSASSSSSSSPSLFPPLIPSSLLAPIPNPKPLHSRPTTRQSLIPLSFSLTLFTPLHPTPPPPTLHRLSPTHVLSHPPTYLSRPRSKWRNVHSIKHHHHHRPGRWTTVGTTAAAAERPTCKVCDSARCALRLVAWQSGSLEHDFFRLVLTPPRRALCAAGGIRGMALGIEPGKQAHEFVGRE
ncbi:hypothetical protein HDK64DRAFT_66059 [Phyllosticta capitalensis]